MKDIRSIDMYAPLMILQKMQAGDVILDDVDIVMV